MLFFADSPCPLEHEQTGLIGSLVTGKTESESLFHAVDWNSDLSKRPGKSSKCIETFAAGKAIEMTLILRNAYEKLLGCGIPSSIILNCKYPYKSLTALRIPTDKSILADVSLIQHFFTFEQLNYILWIPYSLNILATLTKLNSRHLQSLQNVLIQTFLQCQFTKSKTASSNRRLSRSHWISKSE